MEEIYVYDFDETIYDGDVTRDFFKFCLKNHPKIKQQFWFMTWAFIKYIFGFYKWTDFKSDFLSYFKHLDDFDLILDDFWDEHKFKIKKWYLEKNHSQDVIISASPQCLLEKICYDYLKVKKLIATNADKTNGKIIGKNCYGNQKVERLNKEMQNYKILEFYSDSLSDEPLAKLAEKSYIVIGDELINWSSYELPLIKKLMNLFLSRDFILFIFVGIINTFNGVLMEFLFLRVNSEKMLAFCYGYLLSTVIGYLLNNSIIFKKELSIVRYIKFLISYIPNFLIQLVIMIYLCNILHLNYLLCCITSAVLGVPITFLCLKLFAYKPKNKDESNIYLYKEE